MSTKKIGPFTLPLTTPWGELTAVGKVRRIVFWVSMIGNAGLIASSQTAQSDAHIGADGTRQKRKVDERAGSIPPAQPQKDQAGEDSADEKRDEPEQQEGTPTPA